MGELSLRRMGGGAKVATGTFAAGNQSSVTVTSLDFKPDHVAFSQTGGTSQAQPRVLSAIDNTFTQWVKTDGYVYTRSNGIVTMLDDGFTYTIPSGYGYLWGDYTFVAWKDD